MRPDALGCLTVEVLKPSGQVFNIWGSGINLGAQRDDEATDRGGD